MEKVKNKIQYNRANLGTLMHLLKLEKDFNPTSYEEWTQAINSEFGTDMTVEEVINYFAIEREMEDTYRNLTACGR